MRWIERVLCIIIFGNFLFAVSAAQAGTTVIFINGINNTPQMAADNTNILLKRYCDSYSCADTEFTLYYNNTDTFFDDVGELNIQAETEQRADVLAKLYVRKALGLTDSMVLDLTVGSQGYTLHRQAKDAYVSLLSFDEAVNKLAVPQDLNTFGLDAKNANQAIGKSLRELRKKVIDELSKDAGTRKVILVPHSQGNYFAQTVAASVRAVEVNAVSQRLAVMGVASVSSLAIERNEHVSLRQDRALFLHAAGTSYYVNGNFDAGWSLGPDPSGDDFLQATENSSNNHGFIETYFNARFLPLPISSTKCGLVPVPKEQDPRQLWDSKKLAYGITCSYRPDFSTMPTLMGVGSTFLSQRGIQLHSFITQKINTSIVALNSERSTLNGRTYEVITCGTWSQCRDAAIAKGGQLVTIRSQAENDWLMSTFASKVKSAVGFWIGYTDSPNEGVWRWTSQESSGFENWGASPGFPPEPNNSDGLEHYTLAYVIPGINYGKWNDAVNDTKGAITEAIVEYLPNGDQGRTSWDLAGAFTTRLNPSGAWSYGYRMSSLAAIQALSAPSTNCSDLGLACWLMSAGAPQIPFVGANLTGGILTKRTITVAPNEVVLHPGMNGEQAIVAWKAPAAGTYRIKGVFTAVDVIPSGVTATVDQGLPGSIYTASLNSSNRSGRFDLTLQLAIGQVLYFSVDAAGNYGNDSTALSVTINNAASVAPTLIYREEFDSFRSSDWIPLVWRGSYSVNDGVLSLHEIVYFTSNNVILAPQKLVVEFRMGGYSGSYDESWREFEIVEADSATPGLWPRNSVRLFYSSFNRGSVWVDALGTYGPLCPGGVCSQPAALIGSPPGIEGPPIEYRLTIDGDMLTIEQGQTLDAITWRASGRLAKSMVGKNLRLNFLNASKPGGQMQMDWIRVYGK